MQLVAAPAASPEAGPPARFAVASRTRTVPRFLPAGVAPERGLQVRTIQAARSISDAFPQIMQIGGVRADALRWHPNGLALDVMVPNPSSAEGIALGDSIVAYVMENAGRFGLQDAIWRGVYYTPGGGAQRGGYGHYDHVHVTTTGGGYPSGSEVYLR
ncbi:glycoside hydrolase [Mycolicibacter virginiensis]|uniref:Glycoside hydrolase n=1 Tax=Mycolicibacter virginiensis TaxID=1795032 RepID=A0A9X7IJI3_9MYCO|nr:glycoside hydrolase [Mycolicibacter virginiensis]